MTTTTKIATARQFFLSPSTVPVTKQSLIPLKFDQVIYIFRITYRPWVKGYGRSVGDPKATAMGGLHLALAWMMVSTWLCRWNPLSLAFLAHVT